jgi:hypothetical protein
LADLNASSNTVADSVDSLLDSIEVKQEPETSVLAALEEKQKQATGAGLLKQFVDDAGKALKVTSLEGWYQVEIAEILKHPGKSVARLRHILPASQSLPTLLKRAYPDHVRTGSFYTQNCKNG